MSLKVKLSGKERVITVWRNMRPCEIVEVEELYFDEVDEEWRHHQWRAGMLEDCSYDHNPHYNDWKYNETTDS